MKRKIIKIDKELCNGCGDCVTSCAEGAIAIIKGKAELVKEDFCDGFGDCIGDCHSGALTIEEREANPFNVKQTIEHLQKIGGDGAVKRFKDTQDIHDQKDKNTDEDAPSMCPIFSSVGTPQNKTSKSELTQWPVQLHLVSARMPIFKEKELLILSTCSPIASSDIHEKYIKDRAVVIACPKLDQTEPYIEKLASIFKVLIIPKVKVVLMEVPCCSKLSKMTSEAMKISQRDDLKIEIHIIKVDGSLNKVHTLK